jgi:predicted phage-related endonuclease
MQIQVFNDEQAWLDARVGRITGTRAKDTINKRGGTPKAGFYQLIAERVALPANGENAMDRGHRLEDEAVQRFTKETKKKVNTDLAIWFRDDNEDIAVSPDGRIGQTEAVEVKCLNSAAHIEAILTKEIPSEYEYQALQYFVVNDKLKKLYVVFYDPRMPRDFFYITLHRKDVQEKVTALLEAEREALRQIAEIEKLLTF